MTIFFSFSVYYYCWKKIEKTFMKSREHLKIWSKQHRKLLISFSLQTQKPNILESIRSRNHPHSKTPFKKSELLHSSYLLCDLIMALVQDPSFLSRLFIEKERNRVVMDKASGDLVDTLFNFLTLPLGTIIPLAC